MLKFVQKSLLSVVAMAVVAASASAYPASSFGSYVYRLTWEDATRRAAMALQAEGYTITVVCPPGQGHCFGGKGVHTAIFTWSTTPTNGELRVNVIVASENNGDASGEVGRLMRRFVNPAQARQMTVGRGMARNTFSPGELIQVPFESPAADAQQGWVGIRYAGSNNLRGRFAVQYLRGSTSGIVNFQAPAARGDYEIVIFNREPPQDGDRPIAAIPLYVR